MVLSALAFLGSFLAERAYASRAQLIQRVERGDGADLFGDAGTPIGSPQHMIIDDPKAFIEGQGEGGARLVDDGYLKNNGIYPLQMKSVAYSASLVRYGSLVFLVVSFVLFRRLGRKSLLSTMHK